MPEPRSVLLGSFMPERHPPQQLNTAPKVRVQAIALGEVRDHDPKFSQGVARVSRPGLPYSQVRLLKNHNSRGRKVQIAISQDTSCWKLPYSIFRGTHERDMDHGRILPSPLA